MLLPQQCCNGVLHSLCQDSQCCWPNDYQVMKFTDEFNVYYFLLRRVNVIEYNWCQWTEQTCAKWKEWIIAKICDNSSFIIWATRGFGIRNIYLQWSGIKEVNILIAFCNSAAFHWMRMICIYNTQSMGIFIYRNWTFTCICLNVVVFFSIMCIWRIVFVDLQASDKK